MAEPSPMNPLQIQVYAGAAAGRRARFDRSPITFGREPDNLLVVDDAYVSRYHGELRFEGGQWILDNKSSNGTKLGRRNVTDKPQPIRSGDEVSVGGKLLFSVTIEPVEGPSADERSIMDQDDQDKPAVSPAKKKQKLYMAIAIYMILLLGLVIFLSTLKKGSGPAAVTSRELTRAQVEELVRRPLPATVPSESSYRRLRDEAEELYAIRGNSASGLYDALKVYKQAAAVAGTDNGRLKTEDALAQGRFTEIERVLAEKVYTVYIDGINRLRRGDDEGAYKAIESAKILFGDVHSPLFNNYESRTSDAARGIKGKLKRPK